MDRRVIFHQIKKFMRLALETIPSIENKTYFLNRWKLFDRLIIDCAANANHERQLIRITIESGAVFFRKVLKSLNPDFLYELSAATFC
jgi:hypothetical protein